MNIYLNANTRLLSISHVLHSVLYGTYRYIPSSTYDEIDKLLPDFAFWFHYGLSFRYELDNGQIFSEAGGLANGDGSTDPYVVVSGAYSYVVDGITYWVTYTADEEGYHPIVGQGPGGIQGGGSSSLDPSVFKSLVG